MNEVKAKSERLADLRIERVRPEEIDRLLAIERESFSVPWTRKMFEAEVTGNPFSQVDVARVPGATPGELRLIGFVCYWVVFDELHLLDVAVEPAFRRMGVGRRLVAHALAGGAERGARRALLEVRASNEAAQGLYEGFGFRTVGTRPNYYTNPVEDARLLELQPLPSAGATDGDNHSEKARARAESAPPGRRA
jgi:ribosomal-protein-alanine N-acetyltransferase